MSRILGMFVEKDAHSVDNVSKLQLLQSIYK